MPLDGHAYLVSQGWQGKGSGLRQGAIARPVAVAQKKTLAGIGKDRDDAFPFWDHVFAAAAVNIQVKLHKDDDDSDSEGTPAPVVSLQRTSTGIISNRRPETGAPVLSGTAIPESQASGSVTPRLSVMAAAKQEAARRTLYSMFFRGPTLTSDQDQRTSCAQEDGGEAAHTPDVAEDDDAAATRKKRRKEEAMTRSSTADSGKKGIKHKMTEDESKRERKRRKREEQAALSEVESQCENEEGDFEQRRKAEKAERRRRRAEKRARKEMRRKRKEKARDVAVDGLPEDLDDDVEDSVRPEDVPAIPAPAIGIEKAHPKRKKSDNCKIPLKVKKKRRESS
ncbi:hypothetical protein B0H21DRAFT_753482 [Amylocystis lapponica]|nr:hypothetical protein B0H21DRAFT_753482 [Amylocystis lapponica]